MPLKKSYVTVTDQFCGFGGSSLGAAKAGAEIRLAMNHWRLAVDTHHANFPKADHDCADMSAVDPRRYGSTDILITSPECTNHSLAKGKPRHYYSEDLFGNKLLDPAEERSRATMWDVPRFAEYHDYNIVIVENVVDAGKWRLFDSWLHAMHALGYEHKVVYFNSMFAWPTPQSRDRMYTIFWKKGNNAPDLDIRPLAYCQQCQANVESIQTWKKPKQWGRYNAQYFYRCPTCHRQVTPYYYAAFNAIDWTIPAQRIGDRKRPLQPKTLARIQYGLDKYGRQPVVISTRYTTGLESRVKPAAEFPMPTQPGDVSQAVVFPWLVETGYSHAPDNRITDTLDPAKTQTTRQTVGIAIPGGFLTRHYGGQADPQYLSLALDDALGTITTSDHHSVSLMPAFIAELHGTSRASSLTDPLMCMAASAKHHALINTDAFLSYYYNTYQSSTLAEALNTITSHDRVSLVANLQSLTIEDLTFRMLRSHEVGRAMAFPGDYITMGTERDKVRGFGNAVTPPVMEILLNRSMEALR